MIDIEIDVIDVLGVDLGVMRGVEDTDTGVVQGTGEGGGTAVIVGTGTEGGTEGGGLVGAAVAPLADATGGDHFYFQ